MKFSQITNKIPQNSSEVYPFVIMIGAFVLMICFMLYTGWDAFIFSLGFIGFSAFFISFSLGKSEKEEETLKHQKEDYLDFINEQLEEILLLVDNGNCLFVSPAVENILAYSPKSFKQNFNKNLIHPEDQTSFQNLIRPKILEVNTSQSVQLRFMHKNGSYKWMEMTGKIAFSKKFNKQLFICSVKDISDLKATQSFEEKSEPRASQEHLSLTSLMAAHDLKEPLRTITNYAELLKSRKIHLLDQEGQEFVRFIADGADRLEDLINDIRNLSKLDQSKLNLEWLNPKSIFLEVEKGLRQKIETSHAQIEYQEMPAIEADPQQLKHVFQNILENAIKYCKNETPKIQITCEAQEDSWLFGMKDNGIGMKPEFLEAIFTPFRRLHGTGEFEGTGIGLAICKKIIENHDGVIWAESNGSELGSTFYFSIPKTKANTSTENHPKDKSQKPFFLKTKSLIRDTAAMIL